MIATLHISFRFSHKFICRKNVLMYIVVLIPYLVYDEKYTPQCFILRHHKCYLKSLEYIIVLFSLPQY